MASSFFTNEKKRGVYFLVVHWQMPPTRGSTLARKRPSFVDCVDHEKGADSAPVGS
jgi:hypothetical protein